MKKFLLLISISAAFACQKKEEAVFKITAEHCVTGKQLIFYVKDYEDSKFHIETFKRALPQLETQYTRFGVINICSITDVKLCR